VLRRLVNYTPYKADAVALKYDTHLDFYLSDSALECHRDHLRVDDVDVKVLTMKEPPVKTFAHVLEDLHAVPSAFVACLEWQRLPNANLASPRPPPFLQSEGLQSTISVRRRGPKRCSSTTRRRRRSTNWAELTAMEVHGHFFGGCSTVVLYDRIPSGWTERGQCAARSRHDGLPLDETGNP
jgi:hypothetical protein